MTAYAANKKKKLESGMAITVPIASLNDAGVLTVGGLFGAIGYLLMYTAERLGFNCDIPALMVFVSALLVRKMFGSNDYRGNMNYIKKHDFRVFGCYRIVLGVLVLLVL